MKMHLKMVSSCASMFLILINHISLICLKHIRLMNKLQPNSIAKYTTSGGDFKFRENISLFRK